MQVLTKGHKYELSNLEKGSQVIQFIEKVPDGDSPNLITVNDGTTNEELLEVLIDRMQFLQQAHSCRENALVITKLEEALMWLNKRTEDRKKRKVEGLAQS